MSRLAAVLSGLLLAGSCAIPSGQLLLGVDAAELARLPETSWHPRGSVLVGERHQELVISFLSYVPARVDRRYGASDSPLSVRRLYDAELAARGWVRDPVVIQSDADPAWNWWCRGPYSYHLLIAGLGHPYGFGDNTNTTVFESGTDGRNFGPYATCPAGGVRDPLFTLLVTTSFALFMVVAQTRRARNIQSRGSAVRRVRGIAHTAPYFAFVSYLVIALHVGPELTPPDPIRWLGIALSVTGIGIAVWSMAELGRNYDLELTVHAEQRLVRSGPYGLVRHPIYSGLALHLLGASLATGNLLFVVGFVTVVIPIFMLRARAEEQLLRDHFGTEYDRYVDEVPMLVPGLRARGGKT